jgi:ubiquinone/menaquinone biosynthesis C-methylase UbiE
VPVWTGNGFQLGGTRVPVLEYSENFAGWSDDLTSLHEDAAGDAHPIDRASRHDAIRQLGRHVRASNPVILEIGCSSGYMIQALRASFPAALIIGADVVREPLHRLAEAMPTVPFLRFDLLECPLPDACVDAVVMLNVLEHIEDDDLALSQVRRILKSSGVLVLEVPAGPALYDSYDQALRHFRRYDSRALSAKVRRAGYEVLRRTHLGFFLYPLFALVKRRNQRRAALIDAKATVVRQASRTANNPLLAMLLALETRLASDVEFPVGIRCLLTCRPTPAGGPP